MQTKITWRNVEFAIDDNQVRLNKTYLLNNAKVTLTLRLPEQEKNNPITHLSVIEQNQLAIHFADNSQQTKPLAELVQLFPAKLSSEQLQLYESKCEVNIEHDNLENNLDLMWGEMRVHVDQQHNVLGEREQKNVTLVKNRNRGTVKHLLIIPSELNHKENNLLIFYDHGCIESRSQFQYDNYLKTLQVRLEKARKQAYSQAQTLWPQKMDDIANRAEHNLITILGKVFALTHVLNKMYKNPSLLTDLLNNIMSVLDAKYLAIADDFAGQHNDAASQKFIAYAKTFEKKRYAKGIVWGTAAMILGLALTALMAVFFSGILFSGLGAIIVGCITATAAAVTLITDVSYIKDTFQIGRMRANLKKLITFWDNPNEAIDLANGPLAQPLLAAAKKAQ